MRDIDTMNAPRLGELHLRKLPFFAILDLLFGCQNPNIMYKKRGFDMNEAFKALADPTRRQIITLLKDKDMTAGDIADHFNMTKPSISHHLNGLKQAKLILDERRGQHIWYSLNTTVLQEALGWFLDIISYQGKRGRDD